MLTGNPVNRCLSKAAIRLITAAAERLMVFRFPKLNFSGALGGGSVGAGVFIGGKFGGFIDLSGLANFSYVTVAFDIYRSGQETPTPDFWYYLGTLTQDFKLNSGQQTTFKQHTTKPQKTQIVPKPGNLRSRVEALLAKGGCAKYVQDLLNKVAERNPGNPRHGKTIMEIFGKIEKQGGYQLDARFYNTVSGDLFVTKGGQPATVHLLPWNTYGTPTAYDIREANRNYTYGALHETFHLAGKGGFDDEQLLRAAYDLANKAIPKHMENSKNSLNWSAMFDDELMQHCPK